MRRPHDTRGAFCRVQTLWCCVQLSQAHRPQGQPRFIGMNLRDLSAPVRRRSPATRTSGVTASLELARASGLPCGSPPSATRDASDRRLLPNTFTTSTRASGVFRAVMRLRRERRFTTPLLASAGKGSVGSGAFCSPGRVSHRASGAPVASRIRPARPVWVSRPSSRRRDRVDRMLRERHAAPAIRSTFHRLGPGSSCPPGDRFRPRRAEPDLYRSRDLAITIRRSTLLHSRELTATAFRQPRLAPVR